MKSEKKLRVGKSNEKETARQEVQVVQKAKFGARKENDAKLEKKKLEKSLQDSKLIK